MRNRNTEMGFPMYVESQKHICDSIQVCIEKILMDFRWGIC